MIEANNSSVSNFVDIKKYVGAARIHVLNVNPNNETLRNYGWSIPEGAPEQQYTFTDKEGHPYSRVRFLVQILNLKDKPVIPLDFMVRPEITIGKTSGKYRIIDSFGRVAWASKDDVKAYRIPQYSNGPANIGNDYKPCHPGQDKMIAFLYKYLNVTPLQIFDKKSNAYIDSKNPGHIYIENWADICNGNVREIQAGLNQAPNNEVFVILGVQTTDENKTYQTFLDMCDGTTKVPYFGPNTKLDEATGTYSIAQKRIDEYKKNFPDSTVTFSASPVSEWSATATEVKDNAPSMFDDNGNYALADDNDDLPFAL